MIVFYAIYLHVVYNWCPISLPSVDLTRVKLYPRPGEEGSDYISASYVDVSFYLKKLG